MIFERKVSYIKMKIIRDKKSGNILEKIITKKIGILVTIRRLTNGFKGGEIAAFYYGFAVKSPRDKRDDDRAYAIASGRAENARDSNKKYMARWPKQRWVSQSKFLRIIEDIERQIEKERNGQLKNMSVSKEKENGT